MKLIQNAPRWPILITSLLLISVILSGCATPIKIDNSTREKVPLNAAMPEPLTVTAPKWIVVTPENAKEVWDKLSKDGVPVVIFALTPDGYKELSLNLAEIRALISEQREIIIQYKQYYEPKENAKPTK